MLKETKQRDETDIPLPWLSHWMVYGEGCGDAMSWSLSTKVLDATFVQLPPSMMREHTLPPMVHLVWKMASLCWFPSWVANPLKARLTTKSSPSSGPSSTSSRASVDVFLLKRVFLSMASCVLDFPRPNPSGNIIMQLQGPWEEPSQWEDKVTFSTFHPDWPAVKWPLLFGWPMIFRLANLIV